MKQKPKAKREGPLSIPLEFDDAMRRAIAVKPPEGGWGTLEAKRNGTKTARRKAPRK